MSINRYWLAAYAAAASISVSLPAIATGVTAGMGSTSSIGSADIHGIKRQALTENRVHPDKPHGDANRVNTKVSPEELTDKCQQTGNEAAACDSL